MKTFPLNSGEVTSSMTVSNSTSSMKWPRVFRMVLTFSFSIVPRLPESNMVKAFFSTVEIGEEILCFIYSDI